MIVGPLTNEEKLRDITMEVFSMTEDPNELVKYLDDGDLVFFMDDENMYLISKEGVKDLTEVLYSFELPLDKVQRIKEMITNAIDYQKKILESYELNKDLVHRAIELIKQPKLI